ncbi:TlpA family protein disulfide reductase [Luteimonas sp. SJ-92]|uniref:TlpA family protein disulfide reductase n=1 Tax=Luteimonas salinisoli TaxID=2752307 RepID=A0A853JFA4_9GAMM|nr:TlpA disulfide reductase family protein [Luteimonas salinisoli]NZA27168.1 TlpA family protein disulfide reductase [Luteimonas salinisoli]
MDARSLWYALGLAACLALSGWAPPAAAAAAAPTFVVGDSPPALAPMAAWIKGGPVVEFRPGHVYVVKFFATWCGASRESMAQLSELARRHAGRLTVVGVNVREAEHGEADAGAVADLVERRGDQMDYIVAMDDPERKTMFEAWMSAAGTYAIPTAFIIGRDGRLAYVGFPLDQQASYTFEQALEDALAGTSDLAAARSVQAQVNEQTRWYLKDRALLAPLHQARDRGDHRGVLAEADRIVAHDSRYEARLFAERLAAMLHVDEGEALAFADRHVRQARAGEIADAAPAPRASGTVGRTIAREQGLSGQAYERAVDYLQASLAGDPDGMLDWLALAQARYRLGDLDRAIAAQERAIELGREIGEMPAETAEELERTLAHYRREGRER